MTDLWYGTSGPPDAEIVIVGEAWGAEEAQHERPFVGQSGRELDRMLAEAGTQRGDVLCTNICAARPPQNDMWHFFIPKSQAPPRIGGLAPRPHVVEECRRLYSQIHVAPRRVVVAVGNYALWALSHRTGASIQRESDGRPIPVDDQTWAPSGIMNWRGSMWYIEPHPEFGNDERLKTIPLLPVIHPAAIMRAWYNRAVTVHDLRTRIPKALSGDWRPNPGPTHHYDPTFAEIIAALRGWRNIADQGIQLRLACDIETARGFVTVLGIADSPQNSLCIRFIRRIPEGFDSHWPALEEIEILRHLSTLLTHPNVVVEGQNFIYDTQYIQHWMGFQPRLSFDTMLAQNVLYPGTPKDLAYLSSLYCDYHWYWKEDHKEWDLKGTVDDLAKYNCIDCCRTWEIAEAQRILIKHLGQESQMQFKMQINDFCLRMMNRGVLVDRQRRGAIFGQLDEARCKIEQELLRIVPQDLVQPDAKTYWFNSPKQTKELFHNHLGMKRILHRKTGKSTTGKEALTQLERRYPEFTRIFKLLDDHGSISNSLGVLKVPLDPDNRMRCAYNPGGTETHRLSSSENAFGRGTNLQNLTKGEEDE